MTSRYSGAHNPSKRPGRLGDDCFFLNIFSADRSQSAAPFVTHLIVNFEIGHLHSDTGLRLFLLLLKEAMHSSWDNSSACILLQ